MTYQFLTKSEIFGNDLARLREELIVARGKLSELLKKENIEDKMEAADAVILEPLDSRFRTHPSNLTGYNAHVESLMQRKDGLSSDVKRFISYIVEIEAAVFNLYSYNSRKSDKSSGKEFMDYLGIKKSLLKATEAQTIEALVA